MQGKETKDPKLFCSRCGAAKIKNWDELSADEKFLVERMPDSSRISPEERKHRLYCARCFYERADEKADRA